MLHEKIDATLTTIVKVNYPSSSFLKVKSGTDASKRGEEAEDMTGLDEEEQELKTEIRLTAKHVLNILKSIDNQT